jgi:hypothetical protein
MILENEQSTVASPSNDLPKSYPALDKAREKKVLLRIKNESGINPILKAKLNPKSKGIIYLTPQVKNVLLLQ